MQGSKSPRGARSKFPPQGSASGFQVVEFTQGIRGWQSHAGGPGAAEAVALFFSLGKVLSSTRMSTAGGANEAQ